MYRGEFLILFCFENGSLFSLSLDPRVALVAELHNEHS